MTTKALSSAHPHHRSKLNRLNAFDYILIVFLTVFALLILYPFYNSVCVSLVSQADYIKTRFMLYRGTSHLNPISWFSKTVRSSTA